jgi:uncharacterized protein with GYD domain
MPTYLHIGTYTRPGTRVLREQGGSARAAAVRAAVEGVGGSVREIFWALGGSRVYAIIELPDDVTATALNLAADDAGALDLETVRLLSAEEMDLAARQSVGYAPPGIDE